MRLLSTRRQCLEVANVPTVLVQEENIDRNRFWEEFGAMLPIFKS